MTTYGLRVVALVLGATTPLMLAATVAHGAPAPAGSRSSWDQFQGGAAHVGVPSAATGSPAVPIPPFRRAWAFPPGGGDRGLSGAVIEGGVAIAAGTAGVYGVVLKSGTPAWPKIPRGGGPISMPAVGRVAGKPAVLFTQGAKADTAKLVAYDLATRKLLWADPLGSVTRSGVT